MICQTKSTIAETLTKNQQFQRSPQSIPSTSQNPNFQRPTVIQQKQTFHVNPGDHDAMYPMEYISYPTNYFDFGYIEEFSPLNISNEIENVDPTQYDLEENVQNLSIKDDPGIDAEFITNLRVEFSVIFYIKGDKLYFTNDIKHRIDTKNAKPV